MARKKHSIPCLDRLLECASRDETRYHLQAVYLDGEKNCAVSTDGHRMYVSYEFFSKEILKGAPGVAYRADVLKSTCEYVPVTDGDGKPAKYPHWTSLVPWQKKWSYVAKISVPKWIDKIKREQAYVTLDPQTGTTSIIGVPTEKKGHVNFNAGYLAPFASETVLIAWSNENEPFVVVPEDGDPFKLEKCKWFCVVMPARATASDFTLKYWPAPEEKIEINKPETKEEVVAMVEKPDEPKVLSLDKKRREKTDAEADAKAKAERLKCQECGHITEDEGDFDFAVDAAPNKDYKFGTQDSGRYVCPKCECFTGKSVLDDAVTYKPGHGIMAFIPEDQITGLLESIDEIQGPGGYFNMGSAMLNAVRDDLIKQHGDRAALIFPADREEIEVKSEVENE